MPQPTLTWTEWDLAPDAPTNAVALVREYAGAIGHRGRLDGLYGEGVTLPWDPGAFAVARAQLVRVGTCGATDLPPCETGEPALIAGHDGLPIWTPSVGGSNPLSMPQACDSERQCTPWPSCCWPAVQQTISSGSSPPSPR